MKGLGRGGAGAGQGGVHTRRVVSHLDAGDGDAAASLDAVGEPVEEALVAALGQEDVVALVVEGVVLLAPDGR